MVILRSVIRNIKYGLPHFGLGGQRPEVEATLYIIGMYVTTVTFLPSYPILKPQDGWSRVAPQSATLAPTPPEHDIVVPAIVATSGREILRFRLR